MANPAIYLLIESGMRGAVWVISKRYAKANKPKLDAVYHPNSPSTYIIYLDSTTSTGG